MNGNQRKVKTTTFKVYEFNREVFKIIRKTDGMSTNYRCIAVNGDIPYPLNLVGHTGVHYWLTQRVCPENRLFMQEILCKHDIRNYDLVKLLKLTKGRSSADNYEIKITER